MNIWNKLEQWASKRLNSISIVLVKGPESSVGLSAIMERPGGEPLGPLVNSAFWADDWAGELKAAAAVSPPDVGLYLSVSGRQYYVSGLDYPRSALVLGGGHVGAAVSTILRFLEFEVTLMEDRAEFLKPSNDPGLNSIEAQFEDLGRIFSEPSFDAVIIVTRGHAQDTACLRQALSWSPLPSYLGMIGSRRRTADTLTMLAREGWPQKSLDKIHTPIGLPIGAQTPQEIAVSIAAEIIQELSTR
ncbi:hypothetical protein C4J81_10515 [Deltaproteobacteria bacterium Smac51]|nr:hypothetical protein C4J81_10515 [Deltaproteobacteria bacterium Smac51]